MAPRDLAVGQRHGRVGQPLLNAVDASGDADVEVGELVHDRRYEQRAQPGQRQDGGHQHGDRRRPVTPSVRLQPGDGRCQEGRQEQRDEHGHDDEAQPRRDLDGRHDDRPDDEQPQARFAEPSQPAPGTGAVLHRLGHSSLGSGRRVAVESCPRIWNRERAGGQPGNQGGEPLARMGEARAPDWPSAPMCALAAPG